MCWHFLKDVPHERVDAFSTRTAGVILYFNLILTAIFYQ